MRIAKRWDKGVALIEALVALLIVSLGMIALTQFSAVVVGTAGETKAKSFAIQLAQSKLEQLRNTDLPANFPPADGTDTVTGINTTFTRQWTRTAASATPLSPNSFVVTVTWTNASNVSESISLSSNLAFADPSLSINILNQTNPPWSGRRAPPIGSARVPAAGEFPTGTPGVSTDDASQAKVLRNSAGKPVLVIDAVNGTAQAFSTISGRIYIDNTASFELTDFRATLSSQGVCLYGEGFYDSPVSASILSATNFDSFAYTCYVGTGWYGNVGVYYNGSGSEPKVCLGDKSITEGGKTASPVIVAATVRVYRGFTRSGSSPSYSYLTRGTANGDAYPTHGRPRPVTDYSAVYSSGNNYFNHNFLAIKKTDDCAAVMQITGDDTFARNAGRYFCLFTISNTEADNVDSSAQACPDIWPNFSASSPTCTNSITVSGYDKNDNMAIAEGSGSCNKQPGNVAVWTCSGLANGGSGNVIIEEQYKTGSTYHSYSPTKCVRLNASTNTQCEFTIADNC